MQLVVDYDGTGVSITATVPALTDSMATNLNQAPIAVTLIAAGLGFHRLAGRSQQGDTATWHFSPRF